jgi:hypothetical protein
MRVGDMHSPGAGSRGRGCLLLRVLQRGYRSLLQTDSAREAILHSWPRSRLTYGTSDSGASVSSFRIGEGSRIMWQLLSSVH